MYSKKSNNSNDDQKEYIITPPPGYDGSRFRSRSDGRDDSFPPYNNEGHGQIYSSSKGLLGNRNPPYSIDLKSSDEDYTDKKSSYTEKEAFCEDCENEADSEKKSILNGFFPFLKNGIGQEELLIIGLIIILASEKNVSTELILMLALLLCV